MGKKILHHLEVGDGVLIELVYGSPLLTLGSVNSNELVQVGISGVEAGGGADNRGRRYVLLISGGLLGTWGGDMGLLKGNMKLCCFVVDGGVRGRGTGGDRRWC